MTKKRILVVDDEESIRESLKLILDEAGFETVLASSGIECSKILENDSKFDLISLDIKMPQESGLDTLNKIKASCPNIKVIATTGYHSTEVAREAIKRGASDYIVKPFKAADVVEKIKLILK